MKNLILGLIIGTFFTGLATYFIQSTDASSKCNCQVGFYEPKVNDCDSTGG